MALRNIVKEGDEVLRKKSFEVTDFGEKTHTLLDDMKETLIKADGVGLAAPQVGVLRRLFITLIDGEYNEFLNPVIVEKSGKCVEPEGCLSVPNLYGDVLRPTKLKINYQDRYGNKKSLVAYDFFAKAICHEYDHLEGVLFIDKATNLTSK